MSEITFPTEIMRNPFSELDNEGIKIVEVKKEAHERRKEQGIVSDEYKEKTWEELGTMAEKIIDTRDLIEFWKNVYSGKGDSNCVTLREYIGSRFEKVPNTDVSFNLLQYESLLTTRYLLCAGMEPKFWESIGVDEKDFKI